MKPLEYCVNGDHRPVQPPSRVLCQECFAVLDQQMHALGKVMDVPCPATQENDDE